MLAVIALLTACDARPLDQREYSKQKLTNIPELADCVYIKLDDIRIIRCPKSDTAARYTVSRGKYSETFNTIEIDQ